MAVSPNSEKAPSLPIHESLAVVTLLALLFILTLISIFSNSASSEQMGPAHYTVVQEIEVFVQGEVRNPGRYVVKRGTLVKEVLAMAEPTDFANTSKLKLENKLRKGQTIKVPKQLNIDERRQKRQKRRKGQKGPSV